MASAVGLADVTPPGYRKAAANGSEPAPGDIEAFRRALADGRVDMLIFNRQTEGAVPDQLREAAEKAKVPVVEVTETAPAGGGGFVEWQVDQLRALAAALG
jgi:zinc/manganese transport system substrate-binding protein